MLKNIRTLIKIAEFELNEQRRKLVEVQSKRDGFLKTIDSLEKEKNFELANIDKNNESKGFLQNYLNGIKNKQNHLRKEADKLLPEINKLLSQVSDKFREVKKYEMVLQNKLEELDMEEKKKIQQELDEMALMRHESSSSSG